MSEMQSPQDNNEDTRPVGRFLLSVVDFAGERDMYEYASKFAVDYRDMLNSRHKSSRVAVDEIDGRRVELEFANIDSGTQSYLWKIQISGDKFDTEMIGRGAILNGGEQYDIYCTDDSVEATYYELNIHRSILRKRKFGSVALLNTLQGVIEYMTDTKDFHKMTSDIRGSTARMYADTIRLGSQSSRSHSENKHLDSIRSQLFDAGFTAGSVDISDKIPLLGN